MIANKIEERRLYGVPGAENCYFDPATVWESEIEPWLDEAPTTPEARAALEGKYEIEEWSISPHEAMLPSAERLLENLRKLVIDMGEFVEVVAEAWEPAFEGEDVVAAMEKVRELICAGVGNCYMANKRLRTLTVTFDEAGDPMLDGQPMYVPTVINGEDCRHINPDLPGRLQGEQ